jgi:hypothetical protein
MGHQMLTDMQKMFIDVVTCKPTLVKGDGTFGSGSIYYQVVNGGYNGMKPADFYIHEAGAVGGAWWMIGKGHVHDDGIVVEMKAVFGIMRGNHEYETFRFDACVPGFPDNIHPFLVRATLNARRTRELQSCKMWARRRREQEKRHLPSERLLQQSGRHTNPPRSSHGNDQPNCES